MSKPLSRKYVEDYESDGGFVEDAPKSKKQKSEPRQGPGSMKKDDEGNEYWEVRIYVQPDVDGTKMEIAHRKEARTSLSIQRKYNDRHSRILREGWQGSPRKESKQYTG